MNKIWDNLPYICGGVLVLALAAGFYSLGSDIAKDKICKQIGGTYLKVYQGYRCFHITEIEL